jgi:hypothetical protein
MGEWRFLCDEHRKQPLVLAFGLIFTVLAGTFTISDHISIPDVFKHKRPGQVQDDIGRKIRMDKSGKELEELISGIEAQMLPQGFKVEPRQRIVDDSGEQIAELDIVISGALGSSTVKWLLECRDRPSEGAAPASWIEQLVGRRERFGFDKVFAISTTGFSKAASDFAKAKGLVLRTVSRLTDIKDDFKLRGMVYQFEEVSFAGQGQLETDNPSDNRIVDIRRPMFKRPQEAEFLHFPVFVSRNPETVHSPTDGSGILLFQYDDWLDLLAGDQQYRVHKVRMPFRLNRFTKESKALVATIYSEEGKIIWLEGQFEADTPKGKVKSRVQIFTNADGTETAKFSYDEMPDGYFPNSITLYGSN